jgi:hypothetical protein
MFVTTGAGCTCSPRRSQYRSRAKVPVLAAQLPSQRRSDPLSGNLRQHLQNTRPLFSYSCRLLLPQLPCFEIHARCPGGGGTLTSVIRALLARSFRRVPRSRRRRGRVCKILALCFHIDAKPFSCNFPVLTSIQNPRGWGTPILNSCKRGRERSLQKTYGVGQDQDTTDSAAGRRRPIGRGLSLGIAIGSDPNDFAARITIDSVRIG